MRSDMLKGRSKSLRRQSKMSQSCFPARFSCLMSYESSKKVSRQKSKQLSTGMLLSTSRYSQGLSSWSRSAKIRRSFSACRPTKSNDFKNSEESRSLACQLSTILAMLLILESPGRLGTTAANLHSISLVGIGWLTVIAKVK